MHTGEHLALSPGEKVEVLGTTIPGKYDQHGSDLIFTDSTGQTFTLAGLIEDGVPLAEKISFPDIFQFGSVTSGSAADFPIQLTPLAFNKAEFYQGTTDGHFNDVIGHADFETPFRDDQDSHVGQTDYTPPSYTPALTPQPVSIPVVSTPTPVVAPSIPAPPVSHPVPVTPVDHPISPVTPVVVTPTPVVDHPIPPVTPIVAPVPIDLASGPAGSNGAPSEPVPEAAIISFTTATDSGASNIDALTNDATPTLMGTGTADATIKVYDGATLLGSAPIGSDGTWQFVIPTTLIDGPHSFTVVPTAELQGPTSNVFVGTIDTITNVVYTAFTPDTFGVGTIGTAADSRTDNTLPTFTGTTETGDTVTVVLTAPDGVTVVQTTTVVSTDGTWSVPVAAALANGDGIYTLAISALDLAGNTATTTGSFTLDTTVPVATPVLETASDSAGAGLTAGGWAGTAALSGTTSDDLTNHTTPTFDITTGTGPKPAHVGAGRCGRAGSGLRQHGHAHPRAVAIVADRCDRPGVLYAWHRLGAGRLHPAHDSHGYCRQRRLDGHVAVHDRHQHDGGDRRDQPGHQRWTAYGGHDQRFLDQYQSDGARVRERQHGGGRPGGGQAAWP